MSDEDHGECAQATGGEDGASGAGGGSKSSSGLGAAVVVGAGALLAGRVLGGGVLTGIAGVVAGTIAGRALAKRRGEGEESGVLAERELIDREKGGAVGSPVGDRGVATVGDVPGVAGSDVFESPEIGEPVAAPLPVTGLSDPPAVDIREDADVYPDSEPGNEPAMDSPMPVPRGLGEIMAETVAAEEAEACLEVEEAGVLDEQAVEGGVEGMLEVADLAKAFDRAVEESSEGVEVCEVEDVEGIAGEEAVEDEAEIEPPCEDESFAVLPEPESDVEAAVESVEVKSVEVESAEVESVEVESAEVESAEVESVEVESVEVEDTEAGGGDVSDVREPADLGEVEGEVESREDEGASGESGAGEELGLREVAVVDGESEADEIPPVEAELTPDEIWEMEALGRFTPADAEAPADSETGQGLFPARSELLSDDKDVALGSGFFSSPGGFEDLDDQSDSDEKDASSTGNGEGWRSLEVGGNAEPPFNLEDQKQQFESFFKELDVGAELKEEPVPGAQEPPTPEESEEAVGELLDHQPSPSEAATPVAAPVIIDIEPSGTSSPERQQTRSGSGGGGRKILFALLVMIAVAGGGFLFLSQGVGQSVVNSIAAFFESPGSEAAAVDSAAGEPLGDDLDPTGGDEGGMVAVEERPEEGEPAMREAAADAEPIVAEESVEEALGGGEGIGPLPALLGDGTPDEVDVGNDAGEGLVVASAAEEPGMEEVGGSDPEDMVVDPGDAKSVVMGFLRADTVEQLLPTVHPDEGVVEEIRAYYPEGKVPAARVEEVRLEVSATVPSSEQDTHLFVVRLEGEGVGIPVSVENTSDGYKVDWEAYVQCKDRLLQKFAASGEAAGASRGFYVVLKRSHYFKEDVPDLDDKLCFHLMSPVPGDPGVYAFADKVSEQGRKLGSDTRWGALYFPVVRLSRVENPLGEPYLTILDIVRDKWRAN